MNKFKKENIKVVMDNINTILKKSHSTKILKEKYNFKNTYYISGTRLAELGIKLVDGKFYPSDCNTDIKMLTKSKLYYFNTNGDLKCKTPYIHELIRSLTLPKREDKNAPLDDDIEIITSHKYGMWRKPKMESASIRFNIEIKNDIIDLLFIDELQTYLNDIYIKYGLKCDMIFDILCEEGHNYKQHKKIELEDKSIYIPLTISSKDNIVSIDEKNKLIYCNNGDGIKSYEYITEDNVNKLEKNGKFTRYKIINYYNDVRRESNLQSKIYSNVCKDNVRIELIIK